MKRLRPQWMDAVGGFIRAGTLDELRDSRCVVVGTPGGAVLMVAEGGDVVAVDNRCPHMGFPLHRGSIEDGILTCHWHHARFDLRSDSTFDLWADDVPLRAVRVVEGEIWVAAAPASGALAAAPARRPCPQYQLGDRQGTTGSDGGRHTGHGARA
jgi:nitrite reductase/ring-hydroxylating ferredoxin subunit